MSSQDDLGMLWYGVSGVSFNPADPAEVLLNTGTAAPLLSDHPRPLVATHSAHGIPNSVQPTVTYADAASISQQSQMVYDSNTGDYVNATEYMYETYDGYDEESASLAGMPNSSQSQIALAHRLGRAALTNDEDVNGNPKTKKPKVHQHPALKLKTPIAYQKDTDISAIPIMKEGMAVCKRCGAIGVKHAFYGKERKFCSLACARPPQAHCIGKAQFDNSKQDSEANTQKTVVFQHLQQELFESSHCREIGAHDVPPELTIPAEDAALFKREPPFKDTSSFQPSQFAKNGSGIDNSIQAALPRANPTYLPPPDKKSNLVNSFDWATSYLYDGVSAVPVSYFKHAPMSECWEQMSPGMKVEVSCRDEALMEDAFWVATVVRIEGYKAKLRYEGFVDDDSKDFWVDLCSEDVHPVGWCATQEKPLIPPKSIQFKYKDWKEFLMRRLTGARTLPTNFHSRIIESHKSRFSPGMNLEVVDKNRIAQMRVATVTEVIGKRLHLRYYGASPDDNGFWCHEDASIIHPVGWSREIGHEIVASQSYHEKCMQISYDPDDAAPDLFLSPSSISIHSPSNFTVGMKLEAIDPLNLATICVATIMKVLSHNYLMIRIDSYESDNTCSDWFCYHSSSPCIFPAGFCEINNIHLTPPRGYEGQFSWFAYLNKTQATAAPPMLFTREVPAHGFEVGMNLEAADLMDPRLVCVAKVKEIKGQLLRIHFDGWEDEFDQWIDCQSPDVYPVGWCQMVGYKLEGPKENIPLHFLPKKKMKPFGTRKGRPFGRRGAMSRGVENASPTPANSLSIHPWKRGRKARCRGSTANRPLGHDNTQEIDEYAFTGDAYAETPDLSLHNLPESTPIVYRGKRGRPRKAPLRISNHVNTKLSSKLLAPTPIEGRQQQHQTLSAYTATEDDGASDETSSGVASLADSDASGDCWDLNDGISNSAAVVEMKEEPPSIPAPEPFPTSLKNESNMGDFFMKPSNDFGNNLLKDIPTTKLPEDTAYRECNTPTFCDSPANFLLDSRGSPKLKQEEESFPLSSSICSATNFIVDKESIDFFGDSVASELSGSDAYDIATSSHSSLSDVDYKSQSQQCPKDLMHASSSTDTHHEQIPSDGSLNCEVLQSSQTPSNEVFNPQFEESSSEAPMNYLNTQVDQPPCDIPENRIKVEPIMASPKPFIPRIIDSSYISKGEKIEPSFWNAQDVATFLQLNDCAAYCENFVAQQIDGSSFLKLSQNDVLGLTGMKVGPSLKIHDLIQQLLAVVNPAQARYQATLLRRGITSFGKTT